MRAVIVAQSLLLLAMLLGCAPLRAQFLAPLEASTHEEFDEYLIIEAAKSPQATESSAAAFLRRWPKSGLEPRVREMRFFALQRLGREAEARQEGEAALRSAPDNLAVKSELAVQLAQADVAAAGRLARETLEAIDRFRAARSVPLDQWLRAAAKVRSRAHTALGLVLFRSGDAAGSLRELEQAQRLTPEPDATLSLRLGRLQAALGRIDEARRNLEDAARSDDKAVADLARTELAGLRR